MTVSLTISETLDGAALSDSLAGGGTGVDFGSVVNNSFAPVVDKTANTGRQDFYISHNATIDPITNLKVHIEAYGARTGFTYGGARTAALDYTAIKAMGQSSGSSKNNADGLSSGVWMDMDADSIAASQFDQAARPSEVKIFGDNGTDGIDLASAFLIGTMAMVYNNSGEQNASAPVAGSIGVAGNTVLGDAAHVKSRIYLADAFAEGGIYQWEFVWSYSFTA